MFLPESTYPQIPMMIGKGSKDFRTEKRLRKMTNTRTTTGTRGMRPLFLAALLEILAPRMMDAISVKAMGRGSMFEA